MLQLAEAKMGAKHCPRLRRDDGSGVIYWIGWVSAEAGEGAVAGGKQC